MHWKILRDPYLRPLAERRGEAAVWASGFFFDDDPDDAPLDDVDLRCTPPPKRAVRGERPVVALLTGGLCPPHAGHVATLRRACDVLAAAGLDVAGAYLSPGHDRYLAMKCGDAAIPASERLRQCAALAAGTDWLSVDPWESLHRRVAVNFTDVVARLRAYLRAHVDPRMEVAFVCGGDNARFALAFAEVGWCVIVARPGHDDTVARWRRELAGHPRVLWAEGDHPAASRTLRKGPWEPPLAPRLRLRLEGRRAVATLARVDLPRFQSALLALLRAHVRVAVTRSSDEVLGDEVITLDAMAAGGRPLALSRLYALGGYEPLGHVARPGAPPLAEQLAGIPSGAYILHDDDRMTGSTLAFARELLRDRVTLVGEAFAASLDPDEDLADSRDFLLGADHGGLVVRLPDGALGRAPYVLPYVDPAVRCGVPSEAARSFSVAVWEANERAFRGSGLRVGDLPPAARAVVGWMGPDCSLEALCRAHAEALRRSEPPSTV